MRKNVIDEVRVMKKDMFCEQLGKLEQEGRSEKNMSARDYG